MFRDRRRPKGMEFAACAECNNGTRAADALAAMVARMSTDLAIWKGKEFRKLVGTAEQLAPKALDEIRDARMTQRFARNTDGLLRPVYNVDVEGPALKTQMAVFATKLGMAAFRNQIGRALPMDGLVWTHWVFNGGMTEDKLDAMTSIMPMGGTLSQGKFEVSDQFYYRFNSDGKSTIALTAGFHETLWMMAIASCEQEIVEGLLKDDRLHPSATVRPGGLRDLLSGGGPLGRLSE
jgi:hypothetical protein